MLSIKLTPQVEAVKTRCIISLTLRFLLHFIKDGGERSTLQMQNEIFSISENGGFIFVDAQSNERPKKQLSC